ncbi:MAG: LPS export ABC transporter permease LptF [Acidobacteria bacterium]|nr:LPS export ABC transporter permease LptF [Acidobacteriota bacterium]
MRILTRYILREILKHALLGLVLFTFVLFARDVGRLLELLVRKSASGGLVSWLFLLTLPATFSLTIPMAVLVGILIGLSRMASDGEVTAVRAAGLSVRQFVVPVAGFALFGTALAAFTSVWVAPRAVREMVRIQNQLAASQISAEIQPRVFEESFTNLVLYVSDVRGEGNDWRGVFLADLSASEGPKVTFAERATVLPDPAGNRLQLHLVNGSSHEVRPNPDEYLISRFSESDVPVSLPVPPETRAKPFTERYTSELLALPFGHPDRPPGRIELHRRLALPAACLVLALVGIPLGLSSRRGGKSAGVVLTVLLVFAYYMLFVAGISMARQGRLSPGRAVWMADGCFFVFGVLLLFRVDREHTLATWLFRARAYLQSRITRFQHWEGQVTGAVASGRFRFPSPQLLDGYVLRGFIFYFLVVLAAFLMMAEIITFFDLLNDIYRYRAPWSTIATYFLFLAPQLIYVVAPISVLVAVLANFGMLTKRNEFTAMKASGVSLYRVSLPVFVAAAALSGALFAFDHFYLPAANKKQEALRSQIKGRPPQTYLRPERKWIFGQHSRIYYYNFFEPSENVMGQVSVFDLDPHTFQLRRRISADRARWEPRVNSWVLENGWVREVNGIQVTGFHRFAVEAFPYLEERPAYFKKEVRQSIEMNYQELKRYVDDLHQSGFDVVKLSVQFHKKFSFPLFALIMALIAVPFAFTVGQRGALAGIAVSIGIAIIYWTVANLFENMGNISQLPPAMAAWAPDVLFGLTGVYLLLKVRT